MTRLRLRRLLRATPLLALAGCYTPPPLPPPPPQAARMAADVAYLADPARHGRELGSSGRDSAASYIARQFEADGVAPAMPGGCDGSNGGSGASHACAGVYVDSFQVRSGVAVVEGLGMNVVGVVPGTDPARRGQAILVGAHYDHIGRLSQYSRDPHAPGVRPGGDDNASGTAAMMELARRTARRPLPRTVLFAAFDAEELGLIGSQQLIPDLPVPLDSLVAMLNLDMVGRLRDRRLTVRGVTTADDWREILERANRDVRLDLDLRASGGSSDHVTFIQHGVPSLHFFTGLHPDYHRRTDVAERVDVAGMLLVVEVAEAVLRELGSR